MRHGDMRFDERSFIKVWQVYSMKHIKFKLATMYFNSSLVQP